MASILSKTPPRSMGWAATRWSVVSGLAHHGDPEWATSWTYLFERYQRPLELYARRLLARAPGGASSAQDAADVVQGFLLYCMKKDPLSRADPDQGKFRAYAQVLLRRFTKDWLRAKLAQKRQPGQGKHLVSLLPDDQDQVLPSSDPQDTADFDRSWTEVAIERALERLHKENKRYGLVIRDLIDTDGEGSEDLAERVGLRHSQFPVLKHRARQRFSGLFEEELRSTVSDAEAFADEWRALRPYMP